MMRRMAMALAVLVMVAGCGGDGDAAPDPTTTTVAPTTIVAPTTTAAVESATGVCAEYVEWLDDLVGDVDRAAFNPWVERFQSVDDAEIAAIVEGWTPATPWDTTNGMLLEVDLACLMR